MNLMQRFPYWQAGLALRVPVGRIFRPLAQAHDTAARFNHTGIADAVHASSLGAGERVGIAEATFFPTVLLEPMQTELCVRIEIVFRKKAVDELEERCGRSSASRQPPAQRHIWKTPPFLAR